MKYFSFLALVTLCLGIQDGFAIGYLPLKKTALAPIVPRGGVTSIIAPKTTAKILGAMCFFEGVSNFLAPSESLDTWRSEEKDIQMSPVNEKLIRRFGLTMINFGIITYATIFREWDLKIPAILSSILWIGDTLASLLNNDSEEIGPSKAGDLAIMSIHVPVVFTGLNEMPCFHTFQTVSSAFAIVCGISCLFPDAADSWQAKNTDDLTPALMHFMSEGLLTLGTLAISISLGVTPLTSFAYASIVGTFFDIKHTFFDKEVAKLKLDWKQVIVFPFLGVLSAASILLSKD